MRILPLLLGAAISPVATIGMIAVLTTKDKPKLKGFIYLIGAIIPLLIIGIPGIFLFANIQFKPANTNVSSALDLLAGLLLLVLAIKNFLKKSSHQTVKKAKSQKQLAPAKSLVLGMALMVTNFSTIVLFLPAVKDIAVSSLDEIEKLIVLFISIPIVMAMIALPLVIAVLMPNSSSSVLERLRLFMTKHSKAIVQAMLIVFGIYLLAKGFGVIPS